MMHKYCARLRSGCKINYSLRVGERLPNGYHKLESIFLPLDEPHDTLVLQPLGKTLTDKDSAEEEQSGTGASQPCDRSGRIRVSFYAPAAVSSGVVETTARDASASSSDPAFCAPVDAPDLFPARPLADIDPARNTLTRAYIWYAEQTGFSPALDIRVYKRVPQGAGLGGGSANAAALLVWLQSQARKKGHAPLPEKELMEGAVSIGADVPFFLFGRPAFAVDMGQKLTPLDSPASGMFLVLICPPVRVSTAWAFAALDGFRREQQLMPGRDAPTDADSGNPVAARPSREQSPYGGDSSAGKNFGKNSPPPLTSGDRQATTSLAHGTADENDFEKPVFARYPEIARLIRELRACGAETARMSGTGSCVFGLFRNERSARKAAKLLAESGSTVYMQPMP